MMDALRIYASTVYKSNIELLIILFTGLEEPWVAEPKQPEMKKITDKDGKVTEVTTKFEETIYNKRIKQWICDKKSLQSSIQSLYNIVWRQCSKLPREKLTMMNDFSIVETKEA